MLVAKHFDPMVGIDIHLVIIPPVGPVPIPHPHISTTIDVMDYLPIFGSTVIRKIYSPLLIKVNVSVIAH